MNITILAIDPGPKLSSWVTWNGSKILKKNTNANEDLLWNLPQIPYTIAVIEQLTSYGMPIGESILETAFWTGRLFQKLHSCDRVPRLTVKLHLCHDSKAKDSNIIQALKDRFEPNLLPKQHPKDILKGLIKDQWQAFALAVYYYDQLITKGNIV